MVRRLLDQTVCQYDERQHESLTISAETSVPPALLPTIVHDTVDDNGISLIFRPAVNHDVIVVCMMQLRSSPPMTENICISTLSISHSWTIYLYHTNTPTFENL